MKITKEFYENEDVVDVAKQLLGKMLCTNIDGVFTSGKIVETEAYCGAIDKACHAHLNRRTKRTEVMFGEGGHAYVYLCYGIHALFNIVTNKKGSADAVLIRAIEPVAGIDTMLERRKMDKTAYRLTAGPGILSQALGIDTSHYGTDLVDNLIWLEDHKVVVDNNEIISSARVGIDYAGEDALLPWRFRIRDNKWCSKAK
ncbi:DNA-3-methyladenine glycosylase [Chondrinema litorale]|uniref:DNA-3-methyladenine glycosylase n=1 Tax=Chondrinema litorale TaxID=2994555 RepID=UPI0025436AF7|nr:DNA-3-methyladenine glycosylase [Chondrinema litorale]UZR95031.1 DNA-3-methyladenine glycosylase [Chondrinema litorale]